MQRRSGKMNGVVDAQDRPLVRKVLGAITFQFLILLAIVLAYNRIVYAWRLGASSYDFSDWSAPLYAFRQPMPAAITLSVLSRWITPIVVAIAWILIIVRWLRRDW